MRDEAQDLQEIREALDVDPVEPGIQSHVADAAMSVDDAWLHYRAELERACWEEHMGDVENPNDDRAIIASWQMKFVFRFAWEKALEARGY